MGPDTAHTDDRKRVILEAEGLGKIYPGGCQALDHIDLRVRNGEFIVILGRSGAGKSTLVRCMNRLVQPSAGKLLFEGRDITHVHGSTLRQVRGRIGMIFQQFNLVTRLTVLENVLCGRLRYSSFPIGYLRNLVRWYSRRDQDIAFACLKQVGIEHLALQRADTLSGGQQQRVAIARTLAQEPHMLLADEPIASLDPMSSRIVMDILRRVNRDSGIPVVVNLHQVEFAREYGQRVIGMADGRIVFDGAGTELDEASLDEIYDHDEQDYRDRAATGIDERLLLDRPEPVPTPASVGVG